MFERRLPVFAALAVFVLALSIPATPAAAANAGVWFQDLPADALPTRGGDWEIPLPRHFRALSIQPAALEGLLASAPVERSLEAQNAPLIFTLPYPDGTHPRFRVEESPIMEPALAAQFPDIRTFVAQGIDDPTATARLSLTTLGFHAMVLSAAGTVFIDPYVRGDLGYALSYWKSDARRSAAAVPFHCDVKDGGAAVEPERTSTPGGRPGLSAVDVPRAPSGTNLRTYRLALAATVEYSTRVCLPNPAAVSCALPAMVVSMNRVNGIYEREVAIRMVLIANDNLVIYTANPDPYTNDDGGVMLDENQATLDAVIGTAGYDVGHVFSTGGGGVAVTNGPCRADRKAMGVTGSSSPVGDGFDVDYVAHEMGHQFGGAHTFNGTTDNCAPPNRSNGSAYEPGSGTTIMAYAGICGAEDLQPHSDDTFHSRSFDQIVTFSTGATGNSCAVTTATGNLPPTVNAGPAFTVPKQTPFTLTGSATDPDGDALTYMWEEFDLGSSAPPNNDVDFVRPIFRSFVPLTVPSRTFPRLSDILNNVATLGESMSTRNRTMTFRLTARDNRVGGGGVNYASTTVTINATAGPFVVTQPNTAVTWAANTSQTVTWNVAGTSAAPISCANVAIDLSTDGGLNFPNSLAASTPNDGTEGVAVPNLPTTQGRVRVRCVGNVFFDIGNANFTITGAAATPGFYPLTPCRLADSRNPNGPSGGPALVGGTIRTFPVAGLCGVPADAIAVAVNVTIVTPTSAGNLVLFPAGITPPLASTLTFSSGQVRANNAIVGLVGPSSGSVDVQTFLAGAGSSDFVLDVMGYFK
ncbi:MAG TPA: zinc-dependent metalloprotease family protein [Thermoanaerobaculia bacterium]|nr:zinc-dependent metalloprotease family protein [Thermoanaerobaculia bacterium]